MIVTRALTKHYGRLAVVDRLDLDVRKGDRYGFLGPNGSGKTTVIRMLLGLVYATSGEITVMGKPVPKRASEVLPSIGSLVEGPSAYGHLSGRANLALIDAAGKSGGRRTRASRIATALERASSGISMKTAPRSARRWMTASFFSLSRAVAGSAGNFRPGQRVEPESLAAAQTRLRYARDELDAANAKLKSQEKRLKEAQDAVARTQKKLEEENAKVEQAKTDLAAAKSRAEQAQQKHEEASAEIRRFYQERQGAPAPAKPQ